MKAADMVSIKLRYVVEDVDRHGNVRLYFRRRGKAKVRLHGLPGSDAFMAAYKEALAGQNEKPQRPSAVQKTARGSFRWFVRSISDPPSSSS